MSRTGGTFMLISEIIGPGLHSIILTPLSLPVSSTGK